MTLRNGLITTAAWAALLGFTALAFINSALQISLFAIFGAVILVLVLGPLLAYATWAVATQRPRSPGGIIALFFAWVLWGPLTVGWAVFAFDLLWHLPV